MREDEAKFYGVAAEFATPEALGEAVRELRKRDVGLLETFSPLPIPGIDQALGLRGPNLGFAALVSVLAGGVGCFGMILLSTLWAYNLLIAGRPAFSWPYYIIPSFASAMALGAIGVFIGMLFLCRLPRLNHPVFNIDGIEGVTQDRLFLIVEARADDFDADAVEQALAHLSIRPLHIQRVPR